MLVTDYDSMKKKKNLTVHDKAVRLAEGGIVEIAGHFVKAEDVLGDVNPCYLCNMDSICNYEMVDLCAELDGYTRSPHVLRLANKQR